MKTIISEKNTIFEKAAWEVKKLLDNKPDAVLALSAGEQLWPLYERLCALYDSGELSLAEARLFALGEYVSAPAEKSCAYILKNRLIERTDASPEKFHFPTAEAIDEYEQLLAQCGGIDLAVLDLGGNAQLGFNEPSTPFASRSRIQKLSASACRDLAVFFGGEENVPEKAVTMGIGTICEAKNIILVAFGEEKATAAFKMLYGRNDSAAPAAFLQIPLNVSIYLDEAASSQL